MSKTNGQAPTGSSFDYALSEQNYQPQHLEEFKASAIESLSTLKTQFALTPVRGKIPYLKEWQSIDTSRDDIAKDIASGKADGYGIKLGIPSGGICAIDIDGTAARCKLIDVMGNEDMPLTVEFASGKPDRSQYLFTIPPELWDSLKSKSDKIPNGEAVEEFGFFWNGRQSVLPPSAHPETGGYFWVHSPGDAPIAVIPNPLLEYWLNLITPPRAVALPKPQPLNSPKPTKNSPNVYSIPINRLLTKEHRSILSGISQGGRNNTGASLARDLIGVAAMGAIECDYRGKDYTLEIEGDAEDLFYSYCAGCSPSLSQHEGAEIWRKAQNSDREPSIRDEKILKQCARSYLKDTLPKSPTVPSVPTSGDTKPSNDRQITATVIKSRVEAILSRNLPTVDLQSELVALSRQLGVSKSSLEGIAQELERSITASADKVEIDKILTAQRHQLSPHQILPESIADKIEQISKARGVNPEPLILGELVAVSSVPHANTRLIINNHGDVLSVYPNLFGMGVGDSGSLKSPTIGTGFTKPLRALQTTYIDKYESELIEYKSLYKVWESQDKKERGDEPEPPRLVVVVAEDATMEKIEDLALYQAGICPGIYRDEIIGIFQAFDKHGGKGNDSRSKLLSYYDGSPINIHRVGTGSKISKHDYHPVVFGGIQPEVLKGLAQSIGMDSDGTLCRFLYAPITRTYKAWDEEPDTERIDTNVFSQLIEKVHRLPALECHLDHEGQKMWAKCANYYNHECLTNPQLSQWLKHAYSKAIGQLGKLALTLHLIECATTEVTAIISAKTIERAALALDYFISQAISLVANTEESLESHLVKVLTKSKELGSITPRGVSRIFSSKQRPNAVIARSYLEQLASGGYGVFSEGIFTPSLGVPADVPADVTKRPRMSPTLGHQETSNSNSFNNNVTNVTNIYQPQKTKGVSYESDDNDHPTPAKIYPSPELVTLVTRAPEATAPSGLEGVPELVTNPGTLVTNPGTPAGTTPGTLVTSPGTPSLTVGTLVKHSDPFNVRGNDTGVVENATQSGYQIYWKSDGDTQIAIAFRTYDREELEVAA